MDEGMRLELILKRLCNHPNGADLIEGMATAFLDAIGEESCESLADLIEELIEGVRP